jgi:hypothetical protein
MSEEIINKEEAEKAGKSLFNKIKIAFQKLVNATRIPSLVDVIFKHPNNLNDALAEAPPASNNWVRLGLEKTWFYFVIAIFVVAIYFGRGALIFLINNIAYAAALIPLGILAWWFIRKMNK